MSQTIQVVQAYDRAAIREIPGTTSRRKVRSFSAALRSPSTARAASTTGESGEGY